MPRLTSWTLTLFLSAVITVSCANEAPPRGSFCPGGKCADSSPVSQEIDTPQTIRGAPAKIASQAVQDAALKCFQKGKVFERRLVAASETPDDACLDEVDRSQFTCTQADVLAKITNENQKSILETNFKALEEEGGFTLDQCAYCPANVDSLPCRKKIEENGETKLVIPTEDSFLFLFVKVNGGTVERNTLDVEAHYIAQ